MRGTIIKKARTVQSAKVLWLFFFCPLNMRGSQGSSFSSGELILSVGPSTYAWIYSFICLPFIHAMKAAGKRTWLLSQRNLWSNGDKLCVSNSVRVGKKKGGDQKRRGIVRVQRRDEGSRKVTTRAGGRGEGKALFRKMGRIYTSRVVGEHSRS